MRACETTTPISGTTKTARPPTAMLEVASAQPYSPVRAHKAAIEKVMTITPTAFNFDQP